MDAGDFFRIAGVDADDLRVSVLAAQDCAMQLVFEHHIDAVNALADHALDAAHSRRARTDHFEFSFCHDGSLLKLSGSNCWKKSDSEIFPQRRKGAKFRKASDRIF